MACAAPIIEPFTPASRDATAVLFIIDQLCELGGAEKVLLRMVDRLPRERYSPRVITFKIDETLGIRESISCPLDVFPLRRTYDRNALRVARSIREIVRKHQVWITHTFHETSDLWGGPIAKMSGCPILISSRRDMGFNRQPKHERSYRWIGRYFDQVQTVSEQVRTQSIAKDRLHPRRVKTVYNGIDLPPAASGYDKRELRRALGLPDAKHLVTSVGHIRAIKGFDVLLQAAARVVQQVPGAVFAIAGHDHEPDHTRNLKAQVAAQGLQDTFLFLGGWERVHPLLHASDVFCLLSRSEGLSNALLEAMGCGLPCVATSVGGNQEVVIDGETGFLVRNEDADSAADATVELLNDAQKALAFGRRGREIVEQKFTTEAMMRTVIASYEQLLDTAQFRGSTHAEGA